MNKIYKVIWSQTLRTWIAVAETAKGKSKTKLSANKNQKFEQVSSQHSQVWKLKAVAFALLGFSANLYAANGIAGGTISNTGATAISNCTGIEGAEASGAYSLAFGCNANSAGAGSIAQGNGAGSTGDGAIAIGGNSGALQFDSTATPSVQDTGERKISIISSNWNSGAPGQVKANVDGNILLIDLDSTGKLLK